VDKIGLLIGIILGAIGLYKIDIVLIAGLNYFGKYVFFGLFHLFIVYLYYYIYKHTKLNQKLKSLFEVLLGLGLFLLSFIIGG